MMSSILTQSSRSNLFRLSSKLSGFKRLSSSESKSCMCGPLRTVSLLLPLSRACTQASACAFTKAKALHTSAPRFNDDIKVHIETEYQTVTLNGAEGDSILDIIKKSEYGFEGFGACDGTATCSTCHVYFDQATYDAVDKGISDEELDMLMIVEEKKPTSRLGCQVKLTRQLDGMTVILPLVNP